MHIMDLVLQGVRRFGPSRKFPLKPGFNVIFGPTESGKTTLALSLLDLLFPDRYREGEASLVSRDNPSASRAGLTLGLGQDMYRIVKDFQSGQIAFSQFNRASQKFETIASDPLQIATQLNSTFDLPPYDIYYHLFVASAERMPSALPLTLSDLPDLPAMNAAEGADLGGTMNLGSRQPNPAPSPWGAPGTPAAAMPPGMMPPGMGGPGPMPGMMPGMMQPGMQPGMMPGMMQPGMMPGMMQPGMMPGMMQPGMMPGMMQPGMMQPGMMPGMMNPAMSADLDDGLEPEDREKRLKQLRNEIGDAQKVDQLQYEIDGYQQKLFEVESRKKSGTQFDAFLGEAKEQLERYPAFARLPERIDERLANYDNLDTQKGSEIEKIVEKQRKLDGELGEITGQPPIFKQPLALAAAGLFVAGLAIFFIMGGFLKTGGALAAVAGVVTGAVAAFQFISRMNRRAELEAQLAKYQEQSDQVRNRFEIEQAVIVKLMKDTGSDDIEELTSKITKFRDLQERYKSVLEKQKKMLADLKMDRLEKEEAELKGKIKGLEDEIRKYPALGQGINEMRLEIERLERAIKLTNPASPLLKDVAEKKDEGAPEGHAVPDFGASSPRLSHPGVSGTRVTRDPGLRVRSAPQAFERLLMSGARLFESERGQIIKHVSQRFNLYIQALFGKRYSEARIDPDSTIVLKDAQTGKWVDFEQISPAARDTCYLALQITLLELATAKRHLPVILDNPALRLDETAAIVAGKALKRLSERTQIILVSAQRTSLQFADHSLELS